MIGGSVAAASLLDAYPVLGGQAVRFAVATVVLIAWGLVRRHVFRRPTIRESVVLVLLATCGMVGYGIMLVQATSVADPGNVGVAIGAAPLLIVLTRAAQARTKPAPMLMFGAVVVLAGTFIAQTSTDGGLQWRAEGMLWSLALLAGAASITLLGASVITTLGPYTVTTYACGVSAVLLLGLSGGIQAATGATMMRVPDPTEFAALAFLTIGVTVMVTLLWYGAMTRLGAGRAGLFNGLVPLASLVSVAVVGVGTITLSQLTGAGLVLTGVLVGLSSRGEATQAPSVRRAESARLLSRAASLRLVRMTRVHLLQVHGAPVDVEPDPGRALCPVRPRGA